jgi:hypothetical protein
MVRGRSENVGAQFVAGNSPGNGLFHGDAPASRNPAFAVHPHRNGALPDAQLFRQGRLPARLVNCFL